MEFIPDKPKLSFVPDEVTREGSPKSKATPVEGERWAIAARSESVLEKAPIPAAEGTTYTKVPVEKKHLPRGTKSTDPEFKMVEHTITPVESWSADLLDSLSNIKKSMMAYPGLAAQFAKSVYENGMRNSMTDTQAKGLGFKDTEDYLDHEREFFKAKALKDASTAEQMIGGLLAQVVDPVTIATGGYGLTSQGLARTVKLAAGGAGYTGSLEALHQLTEDGTITDGTKVAIHAFMGGLAVPLIDKAIRMGARVIREGTLKTIERNTAKNITDGKMNPQAAYDKALHDSGVAPGEIASMIDGTGRTQHFPLAFDPLKRPDMLKQLRSMGYSPLDIQRLAKYDPIEGYIKATNQNGILKNLSNRVSTITSHIGEGIDHIIQPTSSALRKISPALLNGLRRNELHINLDTNEWRGLVQPFIQATSKLPEKTYRALHKALINRDDVRFKSIVNTLATEDAPAKGMTRLYRAESKTKKNPPEWVAHEQKQSGHSDAEGRWYVKDKSLLDFYVKDIGPSAKIKHIDVPTSEVNKYLVSRSTERLGDRSVKSFSRDPNNEFFLPKDLASKGRDLVNPRDELMKAKDSVDTLMEAIYTKYKQVGVDMQHLDKYFPRLLKKGRYKQLVKEMGADPRSPFAQLLKQKQTDKAFKKDFGQWVAKREDDTGIAAGGLDAAANVNATGMKDEFRFGWEPRQEDLTEKELNTLLNSYLKGITPQGLRTPSAARSRVLETVPDELLQHYGSIEDMLTSYIDHAAHTINIRKFFGKHMMNDTDLDADGTASIGSYVNELFTKGEIHVNDVDTLKGLLQSRMGYKPTGEINQDIKNVFYMTRLGQLKGAITQFGDLGISSVMNGFRNTISALYKDARITREDIGVAKIAEEFGTTSGTANALNHVFRYSGFKAVDNLGKKAFINAALMKNERLVSTGRGLETFKKKWQPYFGDETANLISDLQKGKMTENVKLLMFNELSDVQPVSLLEMPPAYLNAPNGRMFYAMKTFTIKQLDLIRREGIAKLRNGDASGATFLMKYVGMVTAANVGADKAKAAIAGQEIDYSDAVIANIWRNFGVSQYLVNIATEKQKPAAAIAEAMLSNPWVGGAELADTLYKDFANFSGVMDMESLKFVPANKLLPGGGSFLYNLFGGGAEKYAEKRRQERMRGSADEDEMEEERERATEMRERMKR